MKRSLLLVLPLLTAQLASAQSAVPNAISYQGRVADANGVLIGDTAPVNRKVTLRIYDAATATSPVYAEEQTVTINKGVFSVLVGQGLQVGSEPRPAIATVFNGSERFLGVTVDDGGAAPDPEITPRQQIVSTAFAFRAKDAEVAGSVQQASGESLFNTVRINGTGYMNSNLILNGDNQILLGGGAGDANGALFSNTGGVGLYGRGPTDDQRRLIIEAKGGTTFSGPIFWNMAANGGHGQQVNFWGDTYGIGSAPNAVVTRSPDAFRWQRGGSGAGGGTTALTLDGNGLTVNTGSLAVPNGRVYGSLDRGTHGVFAGSYGDGHAFGSQDWTTYSRSARHFAWYLGGAHANAELNGGGGSRILTLNSGGLYLSQGSLAVENGSANFGNRLGQHLNLWGTSYGLGIQGGTLYNRTGADFAWYVGGSHNDNGGDSGGGQYISSWNNDRVDFYRRVWIGANPGGIAPLEVSGSSGQFLGNIAEFWNPNNNGAGYNGRQNFSANVSIRASNSVVAHNFVATSDIRLKVPEGLSDGAEDLKTLNALEITNYTMKDKRLDGGRQHKKVIAQQVEKVFPQAVSRTPGVVPDIYRRAAAKAGIIAFADKTAKVELKKGETVRLLRDDGEIISEVTAIQKDGFRVKDEVKDGELFVYGHRVDDLRVVEYEAIAMLNVSATQELHRTIQQQAAALKKLTEEKAALEQELTAARDLNTRQETRLAAIEKALELKTTASTPAKQETKVATRR